MEPDGSLGVLLTDGCPYMPQSVGRPKDLNSTMGMVFQDALVSGDENVGLGLNCRCDHEVVVWIRSYNPFDLVQTDELRRETVAERQIRGRVALHIGQVSELPAPQHSREFEKEPFAGEEMYFLVLAKQEQFPRDPASDQRRDDDVRVKNQPYAGASPRGRPSLPPGSLPASAAVPWE